LRPDSFKHLAGQEKESLVVGFTSFCLQGNHLGLFGFDEIDDFKEFRWPLSKGLKGVAVDCQLEVIISFFGVNHLG